MHGCGSRLLSLPPNVQAVGLIAALDAGDDALNPAPTGGAVAELLEAPDLARLHRGFEARRRAGLQVGDVLAQGRGGRQAEDEVDIVGAAPVNDQRAAVVAVGPDQDAGVRPVGPGSPAPGGADERGFQPRPAAWPVAGSRLRTGHRRRTPRSAGSRIRTGRKPRSSEYTLVRPVSSNCLIRHIYILRRSCAH